MTTKFYRLTFVFCNKKFPGQNRFVLLDEMDAYKKATKPDKPKRKRYVNPIVRARQIQAILKHHPDLNNLRLAKRLGISQVRVTQILNLLKLPLDIPQEILKTPRITEHALRPLIQFKDPPTIRACGIKS